MGFLGLPRNSAFGLLQSKYHLALQSSAEERIRVLRHLVKNLNVKREDILIRYTRRLPGIRYPVCEYASALPSLHGSFKRTANGAEKTAQGHCRWIVTQQEAAHSKFESVG